MRSTLICADCPSTSTGNDGRAIEHIGLLGKLAQKAAAGAQDDRRAAGRQHAGQLSGQLLIEGRQVGLDAHLDAKRDVGGHLVDRCIGQRQRARVPVKQLARLVARAEILRRGEHGVVGQVAAQQERCQPDRARSIRMVPEPQNGSRKISSGEGSLSQASAAATEGRNEAFKCCF